MLYKMIADEIRAIEHENECGCVACEATATLRNCRMWIAEREECGCPVCEAAINEVKVQGNALHALGSQAIDAETELAALRDRLVTTPEQEEHIEFLTETINTCEAAMSTLAASIMHLLNGLYMVTYAAHKLCAEIEITTVKTIRDELRAEREREEGLPTINFGVPDAPKGNLPN